MISVPLKAYRVRFDTVLAVRNLELNWKDRIYRMEHGRVATGRTHRGVLAAVIFGKGEAFQGASGKAAGPFQYLYVTMHPDRYGTLLSAIGQPIAHREALEDAAALHRYMFRTSAFRSGERMHLPPDGYVRVQAGVWLRPKNPFYPGRGVRKRHYRDGRVWTTFPDGRQRWRYHGRADCDAVSR